MQCREMIDVCFENHTKLKLCVVEADFLYLKHDLFNQKHWAMSLIAYAYVGLRALYVKLCQVLEPPAVLLRA
jgi:hypothetical protein